MILHIENTKISTKNLKTYRTQSQYTQIYYNLVTTNLQSKTEVKKQFHSFTEATERTNTSRNKFFKSSPGLITDYYKTALKKVNDSHI